MRELAQPALPARPDDILIESINDILEGSDVSLPIPSTGLLTSPSKALCTPTSRALHHGGTSSARASGVWLTASTGALDQVGAGQRESFISLAALLGSPPDNRAEYTVPGEGRTPHSSDACKAAPGARVAADESATGGGATKGGGGQGGPTSARQSPSALAAAELLQVQEMELELMQLLGGETQRLSRDQSPRQMGDGGPEAEQRPAPVGEDEGQRGAGAAAATILGMIADDEEDPETSEALDGEGEEGEAGDMEALRTPLPLTAEERALADKMAQLRAVVSGLSEPQQRYIRATSIELTRKIDADLAASAGRSSARYGGEGGAEGGGAMPSRRAAVAATWLLAFAASDGGSGWPSVSGGGGGGAGLLKRQAKAEVEAAVMWAPRPAADGAGGAGTAPAHPAGAGVSPLSWGGHSNSLVQYGSVLRHSQAPQQAPSAPDPSSGAFSARAAGAGPPHSHLHGNNAHPTPTSAAYPPQNNDPQQPLQHSQQPTPRGQQQPPRPSPRLQPAPDSAASSSCSNAATKAAGGTAGGQTPPQPQPPPYTHNPPHLKPTQPAPLPRLAAKVGSQRQPPRPPPRSLGRGLGPAQPRPAAAAGGAGGVRPELKGLGLDLGSLPHFDVPPVGSARGGSGKGGGGGGSAREHPPPAGGGGLTARSRAPEAAQRGRAAQQQGGGGGADAVGGCGGGRSPWSTTVQPAWQAREGALGAAAADSKRRIGENQAELERKRRRILAAAARAAAAATGQRAPPDHASSGGGGQQQQEPRQAPEEGGGGGNPGAKGASTAASVAPAASAASGQAAQGSSHSGYAGIYSKLLSRGVQQPGSCRSPSASPGTRAVAEAVLEAASRGQQAPGKRRPSPGRPPLSTRGVGVDTWRPQRQDEQPLPAMAACAGDAQLKRQPAAASTAAKLASAHQAEAEAMLPGLLWDGAGTGGPVPCPQAPYAIVSVYPVAMARPGGDGGGSGVKEARAQGVVQPLQTMLRLEELLAGSGAATPPPPAGGGAVPVTEAAMASAAGVAGGAGAVTSGSEPQEAQRPLQQHEEHPRHSLHHQLRLGPEHHHAEPATGFVIISRRNTREDFEGGAGGGGGRAVAGGGVGPPLSSLLDLSSLLPAPAWRPASFAASLCAIGEGASPVASPVRDSPPAASAGAVAGGGLAVPGAKLVGVGGRRAVAGSEPGGVAGAQQPGGGGAGAGAGAGLWRGGSGPSARRGQVEGERLMLPDMGQMQAAISPGTARARYAPSTNSRAPPAPVPQPSRPEAPRAAAAAAAAPRAARPATATASKPRPASSKRGAALKPGMRSRSAPQGRPAKAPPPPPGAPGPVAASSRLLRKGSTAAHRPAIAAPGAPSPLPSSPPPPTKSQTPAQLPHYQQQGGSRDASPAHGSPPRTPTVRRLLAQSPEDLPLSAAVQHSFHTRLAAADTAAGAAARRPSGAAAGAGGDGGDGAGGGGQLGAFVSAYPVWPSVTLMGPGCATAPPHKPRSTPAALTPQQLRGATAAGAGALAPPVWRPAAGAVATAAAAAATDAHRGSPGGLAASDTSPEQQRGAGHDCTPNILSPPRNYDRPWTTPHRQPRSASPHPHPHPQQHQHEHLGDAGGSQLRGGGGGGASRTAAAGARGGPRQRTPPRDGDGGCSAGRAARGVGGPPAAHQRDPADPAAENPPPEQQGAGYGTALVAVERVPDPLAVVTPRGLTASTASASAAAAVRARGSPAASRDSTCSLRSSHPPAGDLTHRTAASGSYTSRMLARQQQQQGQQQGLGAKPLSPLAVGGGGGAEGGAASTAHGGRLVPLLALLETAGPIGRPARGMTTTTGLSIGSASGSSAGGNAAAAGVGGSSSTHRNDSRGSAPASSAAAASAAAAATRAGSGGGSSGGAAALARSAAATAVLLRQAAWPGLLEPRVVDALSTLGAGIAVLDPGAPSAGGSAGQGQGAAFAGPLERSTGVVAEDGELSVGCLSLFRRQPGGAAAAKMAAAAAAQHASAASGARGPVLLRARVHDGAVELLILRPRGGGGRVSGGGPPAAAEALMHVAALSGLHPPLPASDSVGGGPAAVTTEDDPADATGRWVQVVCMCGGVMRLSACAPADHARLALGLNAALQLAAGATEEGAPLASVPLRGVALGGGASVRW
ncbi:hypothetical protein TSOC_006969 [Tetrabaena socialis]|uniref:Uncharacterized protein n=1 Tax=Tetrabaena socialis TaxID=47790 RepID=A0A2J8A2E1_9CHLO|nr:hypothetical protein TSOC_006969 [Tetrabaena socialis]|eukprot:PNH06658.1 hypothetical protein TSOC_006969 [Tetrabaena socialis]